MKKLGIVLAAFALTLSLAACGSRRRQLGS